MTSEEKVTFIIELTNSISQGIIKDIDGGKIPDEWDGIELRYLLEERAKDSAIFGTRQRHKEFKNFCIINNL